MLNVFDLSDLSHPRWRGHADLGGECQVVAAYPYVYAAVHGPDGGFSGLRVMDLTDPDRPQVVGQVEIKQAGQIAHDGSLIVLTSGQSRFQWNQPSRPGALSVVNIADPRRPRLLGTLPFSNPSAVALRGSLAFVGVDRDAQNSAPGLHVVDVSDPSRPRKRGFLATDYYVPKAITLHNDFAYLTMQYSPRLS